VLSRRGRVERWPGEIDGDLFPAEGGRNLALASHRRLRDLALACRRTARAFNLDRWRRIATHRLGVDLAAGERPQAVVHTRAWQSAKSLGGWTLVSCVVAPGFEFSAFELAAPDWRPAPPLTGKTSP
jgi:hypothetical protein